MPQQQSALPQAVPTGLPPGAKTWDISPTDPDVVIGPPTRQGTGRTFDIPPDAFSTVDLGGQSTQDPKADVSLGNVGWIPESARSPLATQRAQQPIPGVSAPTPPPVRQGAVADAVGGFINRTAPIAKTMAAPALSTAGSVVGGYAGGPLAPVTSIAGGIVGEGLGMGVEAALGSPPTREEVAKRLMIEGATGVGGELLTQGAKAAMKGAGRVLGGKPSAEAAELTDLAGGHVLPSQVSDSTVPRLLDKYIAGGWLSAGAQEQVRSQGQQMVEQRLEREVKRFATPNAPLPPRLGAGPAPHMNEEWLGKVTQLARKHHDTVTFGRIGKEFDAVRQAGDQLGLNVDFGNVRRFANVELDKSLLKVAGAGSGQETLSAAQNLGAAPAAQKMGELFGPDGQKVLDILTKPQAEPITIEQAMKLRSDLGMAASDALDADNRTLHRTLRSLQREVDTALEGTLKNADPALYTRYRQARADWDAATDLFRNKFMRDFANADPSAAATRLLADSTTNTAEQIRRTRAAIGRPFKNVQAAAAEQILTNPDGGWKSGTEITKALAKMGDERAAAFFDQGAGALWSLARKVEKLQEPIGKEGSLYLVLRQGAAAGTAAGITTAALTGNIPTGAGAGLATAGAILLTPMAAAKLLYSPTGRALLLKGEVTPEALRLLRGVSQVGAHVGQDLGQAVTVPPTRPGAPPPQRPQ